MRKPWFSIIEVIERSGRSLADIVGEVAREHEVSLVDLRGNRQPARLRVVRKEVVRRVWSERPDLSSSQIGKFLNRDPSAIRKLISRAIGAAA
jgi:chromosomal replication initiation ATPase DnaA